MGGTVTPTLTPAQILAHLNSLGTSGALFDASVFALKDPSAPTKIGKFSAAGITAGQTRTYTLPDATGTVPLLGLAQTWSATQTFGAIDATSIGATTRGTGAFTTLAANGATTLTAGTAASSTTTGTLVVTGGTGISGALYVGGLLNVAGASTLAAVAATTISASGQITSTVSTGTPPLVIASTTNVPNLNASSLSGATFAAPGAIGSGTPGTGAFTTLTASGVFTSTDTTDATAIGTASMVLAGGLSVAKGILGSSTLTLTSATVIPVVLTNTAASSATSGPFFSVNEDDGAALASGDRLGGMLFGGSRDASHTINRSAGFTAFTTEAWSATNCGAKLVFHTVPNGTTARTDALTLDNDGSLILTGPLKLANTYVATPPTCTGYVTLKDSAGTTYKVMVST